MTKASCCLSASDLLDAKPGKKIWVVTTEHLNDEDYVYQVEFLGFIDGQVNCQHVVVTGRDTDGYSNRTQGPAHNFHRAPYLMEISLEHCFRTEVDAYVSILKGLRANDFLNFVVDKRPACLSREFDADERAMRKLVREYLRYTYG